MDHAALIRAINELGSLADKIDNAKNVVSRSSPIHLGGLAPVPATPAWLREQQPMLKEIAAIALLLDTDGDGSSTVEFTGTTWDPTVMLGQLADGRFGPGFVEATGLEGEELSTLLLTLSSVGKNLPENSPVMTATELREFIIDHPDVARALQNTPAIGSPLYGFTLPFMTAPGEGAEVWEQRRRDARELFENLSPDEAAILAMTYPSIVGNLPGVPFENRADANTVNVVVALEDERSGLAGMKAQHEYNQHDWDFLGRNNDELDGPIADSEDRIALYESILNDDRQIVYFDPSGDGAIAELHAPITAKTDNVGVLVPGTGADLAGFRGTANRSLSFQDNDPTGGLSMISWMGGDLPDSIPKDAPFANYSVDLGPRLADFSRDLELEIEYSDSSDAQVTVAGHSYGGAVVGRSELHGLVADRVLHIESAGMGHDVYSPDDLGASQQGVDRYSMTAPGDVIELAQGAPQLTDNMGHGADPDTFEGTTRLHTGNKVDGTLNTGIDSHTAVFQEHSDAWENMYQVFTGGTVETYRSPAYTTYTTRFRSVSVQTGWKNDGESVDIE